MSDRHQQALAGTDDTGVVYAYAYGALKELLRLREQGDYDHERFTDAWHRLIAAVEFRIAELAAEALAPELEARTGRSWRPHPLPKRDTTPIYVSDENAAERPNQE